MRPKYLTQKILLILFSLFISVFLIEGFFMISGLIAELAIKKEYKNSSNTYKILCLGDSSTYGEGSSDVEKFSYPSQLQKLLDNSGLCTKFEVVNLGVPGTNSSKVLNKFRKDTLTYRPDMVVVMIGINDPWNLEESNIIKFYNASLLKRQFLKLELLLNRIHLYRFLKLVLISEVFKYHSKLVTPSDIGWNEVSRSRGFPFYSSDPVRSQAFYYCLNYNIAEMVRIAKDYHAAILFMRYHYGNPWGNADVVLDKIYAKLNVPVIDNEVTFVKAQRDGLNVRSSDGFHPNDFGYSLIAKNIYDKILSLNIGNKCGR